MPRGGTARCRQPQLFAGGAYPTYAEVGPLVYRVNTIKTNIQFNPTQPLVTFQRKKCAARRGRRKVPWGGGVLSILAGTAEGGARAARRHAPHRVYQFQPGLSDVPSSTLITNVNVAYVSSVLKVGGETPLNFVMGTVAAPRRETALPAPDRSSDAGRGAHGVARPPQARRR